MQISGRNGVAIAVVGFVVGLVLSAGLLGTRMALAGIPTSVPPGDPMSKVDKQVLKDTANGQRTSFVILLAGQADVSAAYTMKDQDARGWYVYNTLRDYAAKTQGPIRAALAAVGATYQPFWAANMIIATGDRTLVDSLAARPDVKSIDSNKATRWIDDPPLSATSSSAGAPDTVEWGVQNVNAPQVWALGYTGQGIVVASQDTGVRWTHNALKPQYRGWNGVTADHNYNWWDAIHDAVSNPCGNNSQQPCDDYFHGSHTTGSAVGDDGGGNQIGVAPGAKWIGCRNMDVGTGTPARYTECFQFMIAPTDLNGLNANPTLRPHVIINSWGCTAGEGCTTGSELETIVNNTQAAGIFVEVSAGNSGPACSTVNTPAAIYSAAFSTGAIDISNTLAGFSSRGPSLYYTPNLLKPNVSAPGVNVRSATNSGDSNYTSSSGTSMAGPHVAGVVALLWSARPQLTRDITTTKTILQNTANPNVILSPVQTCGGIPSSQIPNNSFGYGRVDALAAVNSVPPATPTATSTPIPPSATATNTPPPSPTTGGSGSATPTLGPTSTACPIQFSDVPNGSTFYAFVRCLACRLIINGYSDGTFRPNNNVTRGQLSKIVSNSAGFNDPQTVQMFEDVPPGSTFFDYIGRLASRGYINGYSCGGPGEPCNPPNNLPYFRTNNNATRGQITKIVSNAAGFSDPPAGQIFEDTPPGSTFYTYTNRLASRGVMQGYQCGSVPTEPCIPPDNRPYFRPFNNATRGQTSKIVANTFFPNCDTPSAVKR